MPQMIPFREVLEAVDQLSPDEQSSLVDIVQRRIAERNREQLATDIREARKEFEKGGCRPASPAELLNEILP